MRTWQGICLSAVLLMSFVVACHAQNTPEDEYKKLIRVSQDIQPLGDHPFGEKISLYDGSLSFEQTDVSASGNGPLMQIVREFKVQTEELNWPVGGNEVDGWTLELPRIQTIAPQDIWTYINGRIHRVDDWEVDTTFSSTGDPLARCTGFDQPPTVYDPNSGDPETSVIDPDEWWKGYQLVLPGQGSQDVLANMDTTTRAAYPAVTKNHWRFSCLPSTANGQTGEAFLGHAPDGTTYWFNELVYYPAPSMQIPAYTVGSVGKPAGGPFKTQLASRHDVVGDLIALLSGSSSAHAVSNNPSGIGRQTAWMLVTKVQDRFGNWLNYSYDASGNLTGITASDGRVLSVARGSTGAIQSITLQPASGAAARTWTYSTSGPSTITLPDGVSQWHYAWRHSLRCE